MTEEIDPVTGAKYVKFLNYFIVCTVINGFNGIFDKR